VYADDQSSGAKLTIARNLLEQHVGDGTAVVSLQVLQEYYAAATRKLGIEADQDRVRIMAEGPVVCFEAKDVREAIDLHRLRQIFILGCTDRSCRTVCRCGRLAQRRSPISNMGLYLVAYGSKTRSLFTINGARRRAPLPFHFGGPEWIIADSTRLKTLEMLYPPQ
jgi:hypothetical protein